MVITRFDKFLLEDKQNTDVLIDFFGNENNVATYLHTCKTEELCKEIFEEGFEFVTFYTTTDYVTSNKVDVDWKLNQRTPYGNFTLVIQIPPEFMKDLEEITAKPPHENENGEEVYTLPREFVKGYFNRKTSEIVPNPNFNINFSPNKVPVLENYRIRQKHTITK